MQDDYFALEKKIVENLTGIEGVKEIFTPFSVDDMLQLANTAPSISVIYVDDRVGESAGNGQANVVYQQWLVVLSVAEASAQLEKTTQIRSEASPMIIEILKRMQGFNPETTGFKPFKRVSAGVQQMNYSGHLWLPYLFESQMINIY